MSTPKRPATYWRPAFIAKWLYTPFETVMEEANMTSPLPNPDSGSSSDTDSDDEGLTHNWSHLQCARVVPARTPIVRRRTKKATKANKAKGKGTKAKTSVSPPELESPKSSDCLTSMSSSGELLRTPGTPEFPHYAEDVFAFPHNTEVFDAAKKLAETGKATYSSRGPTRGFYPTKEGRIAPVCQSRYKAYGTVGASTQLGLQGVISAADGITTHPIIVPDAIPSPARTIVPCAIPSPPRTIVDGEEHHRTLVACADFFQRELGQVTGSKLFKATPRGPIKFNISSITTSASQAAFKANGPKEATIPSSLITTVPNHGRQSGAGVTGGSPLASTQSRPTEAEIDYTGHPTLCASAIFFRKEVRQISRDIINPTPTYNFGPKAPTVKLLPEWHGLEFAPNSRFNRYRRVYLSLPTSYAGWENQEVQVVPSAA